MNISANKEDKTYVITIDGEIDASSSIELDSAISEAIKKGERKILVDCANLNYISSAGLGVFMSYLEDFEDQGIKIALYQMNDKVKSVFEILGLVDLIDIVPTREEAEKIVE
ncbi:MAG TPA: STAS domain-containing protein [Cytophagaceae bacterium]|jgi:anti-sigma B factor antagonist|nr:STAS domain-containing protein [Cytophagaceae bacterium]